MEGQFGALSSGSPGAIYKINGATGAVTNIADTAFSGVQNSGPGIGGLAFDPASRNLYASDLDTGLIHRFGLDYNAADLSQFDHGVAGRRAMGLDTVPDDGRRLDILSPEFHADDPATWGFTQPQRRIDALAVHDGRLYYAVADGPEIWSVGLKGGAFGDDARREVAIKAEKFIVTGIAFDGGGHMILAQRGPVKSPYDYGSFTDAGGQALRYTPETPDDPKTPDLWAPDPASYAVGSADGNNAGTGGVSLQYGYKPDGSIDTTACDASVALTGDTLATTASGVQLNSVELVRPANVPPTQSAFIAYDARQDDPKVLGHVGNVGAVRLCGAGTGFPPVEAGTEGPPVEGAEGAAPPVEGGGGGGGGGTTAPPVEEGGGGTTEPPVEDAGGGGTTAEVGDLIITKTAGPGPCSPNGGCAFNIKVANPTAAEIAGPVVIDDQIDAAAATLTGEPNAPWTCTKVAPFTCTHPGPVPANGQLDDLQLVFAPNTPPEIKEVKNCAGIKGAAPAPAAPAQNPQLPPPPPPTGSNNGGLKVEKRGIPATCSPAAGTCEFEVKITNQTGHLLKKKPLKIFDTMSVGTQTQAKNVLDHQEVPDGLTCTPEGREFNCTQNALSLNPDASMSFKAAFKIDTSEGGPAGFVTNKALVTLGDLTGEATASIAFDKPVNVELPEPEPGGQANPGAGGAANQAGAPAQSCATIPVEAGGGGGKTQSGPITIEKTPAVKSCDAATPCSFDIKVSNTSGKDIPGPITIAETPPAGVKTSDPPAPWNCIAAAGPTRACTHPGPIPANGSLQPPLNFTFAPPVGATKVENCATLGAPLPAGIPAPAKPACATIPTTTPDQKGQPKLSITKTGPAECSDLGGCDFSIAIKNEGDAPFNGPVVVKEEVTLDGKTIPNTHIVPNETWTCTQEGNSTCTSIPAMIIGPQGTATLRVHVIFSSPTGAKVMQNCASVVGAAAKPCVSANLVQGPKLVIKKESVDRVCDPICTFRITIKNIGNGKFPGPIQIVDFPGNITSNSGQTDIKAEVISAKLVGSLAQVTCKKSGNIWCDINTGLEPGISETIELTMATGLTDFAGDNCVLRRDLPAGTEPPVCVAMLGQRHQGPNLLIEKRNASPTPKGADHCELKKECLYIIRVTNTGTSDFTGPIKVTDTISGGAPELLEEGPGGNLGWNCTKAGAGGLGAPSIDCTIPGAPNPIKPGTFVPLAPGKFIELGVSVKPGSTWKNSNTIGNCAELIDTGADMGPITGAKKSCTTQKLDPFKLKIEKTGDQSCHPGGECKFDLNIFNDEQIVHDDPVTVVDNLTGISSAGIVSITPVGGAQPFPCKPQPTKVPFNCTGHMKLNPGDKNHYTIVLRLPADASAQSFSNCATVGGARSSGETSDPSCHSVQLAPPEQPFSLKIEKTGPATCAPGSECPFDITLTNTGSKDYKGAVTLTDGLSNAPAMSIASITPPLPCTEQPRDIPFTCKTADAFTIPAGGKRTFRVTTLVPRSAGTFTNCAIIASGKAPRSGGDDGVSSCHTVEAATPKQTTEQPRCQGGMILLQEGACACPPNTTWNVARVHHAAPHFPIGSRMVAPAEVSNQMSVRPSARSVTTPTAARWARASRMALATVRGPPLMALATAAPSARSRSARAPAPSVSTPTAARWAHALRTASAGAAGVPTAVPAAEAPTRRTQELRAAPGRAQSARRPTAARWAHALRTASAGAAGVPTAVPATEAPTRRTQELRAAPGLAQSARRPTAARWAHALRTAFAGAPAAPALAPAAPAARSRAACARATARSVTTPTAVRWARALRTAFAGAPAAPAPAPAARRALSPVLRARIRPARGNARRMRRRQPSRRPQLANAHAVALGRRPIASALRAPSSWAAGAAPSNRSRHRRRATTRSS